MTTQKERVQEISNLAVDLALIFSYWPTRKKDNELLCLKDVHRLTTEISRLSGEPPYVVNLFDEANDFEVRIGNSTSSSYLQAVYHTGIELVCCAAYALKPMMKVSGPIEIPDLPADDRLVELWSEFEHQLHYYLDNARPDGDLIQSLQKETMRALRLIASDPAPPPIDEKPHWDKDSGKLTFKGQLAKHIKNKSQGVNVITILNCFQEDDWPTHIDDPLDHSVDNEKLKAAIRSLNTNLKHLCFKGDGTAEGIIWEATE